MMIQISLLVIEEQINRYNEAKKRTTINRLLRWLGFKDKPIKYSPELLRLVNFYQRLKTAQPDGNINYVLNNSELLELANIIFHPAITWKHKIGRGLTSHIFTNLSNAFTQTNPVFSQNYQLLYKNRKLELPIFNFITEISFLLTEDDLMTIRKFLIQVKVQLKRAQKYLQLEQSINDEVLLSVEQLPKILQYFHQQGFSTQTLLEKLFTPQNQQFVLFTSQFKNHCKIIELLTLLSTYDNVHPLSPESLDYLMTLSQHDLTTIVKILPTVSSILSPRLFYAIVKIDGLVGYTFSLNILQELGLLTENNAYTIMSMPSKACYLLVTLQYAGRLSQENLDTAALYTDLLTDASIILALKLIHERLFTQSVFAIIIKYCIKANGNTEKLAHQITRFARELLNQDELQRQQEAVKRNNNRDKKIQKKIQRDRDRQRTMERQQPQLHLQPQLYDDGTLNPAQSTHTASVHKSASKSAKNLANLYGGIIQEDLAGVIEEIKRWIKSLPDNDIKVMAAKRAVDKITKSGSLYKDFIDPVSQITLIELLALAWLAIDDYEDRIGRLEDARTLFIEGLYEAIRGDNLDEVGSDDGAEEDKPICLPGIFNKLLEKLNGIHSAVNIIYITNKTMNYRFQRLIKEKTFEYVTAFAKRNPLSETENLIEALKSEDESKGIKVIWPEIKQTIEEEMLEEFGEEYKFIIDKILSQYEYIEINTADLDALLTKFSKESAQSKMSSLFFAKRFTFFISKLKNWANPTEIEQSSPSPNNHL